MPNPYSEWAFDASQNTPAELVSRDAQAIDDLVDGSHSRGVFVNGLAVDLNTLDVYPVTRIDNNPNPGLFERSSETVAYATGDGGLLYEITGVYTELSLAGQQSNALPLAEASSLAFLNGGLFFDDGGGDVLYASSEIDRANYSIFGVQGNIIGASFTINIRDASASEHAFDNTQWDSFFSAFFDHVIQAGNELGTANSAIAAATNSTEVQAALDAILPPNDTL